MKILSDLSNQVSAFVADTSSTVKVWSSIVTLAVALISTSFVIDARYAHAGDVESLKTNQEKIILKIEYSQDMQRKKQLEDAMFLYDQVPEAKHTQPERAIYNRQKAEAIELSEKWKGKTP